MIGAGFDLDLEVAEWDDIQRRSGRGLPVNFFLDCGKSGRKYVLGALKALYWLELVAWRNHTRQAIEWRWVEPVEGPVRIPPLPNQTELDPYLHDDDRPTRYTRVWTKAGERADRYEREWEAWIDANYPEKAAEFRYQEQLRREARRTGGSTRMQHQALEHDDEDIDYLDEEDDLR